MTMPASPRERTLYRITWKMLGPVLTGQWSEEDLPYPRDGGPNGWVLSGVEAVLHSSGGIMVIAHWCRVDPCDVEELVEP
jgi:hypothetical protein